MKKVLIIVADDVILGQVDRWSEFCDTLQDQIEPQTKVDITSLTNLIFDISNQQCMVIDNISGNDVASYDLVVVRNVSKKIELGVALAHYLKMKQVQFMDEYLWEEHGSGKLACAITRCCLGLPVPHTIRADAKYLVSYITSSQTLTYPLILKADVSKRGRNKYLINSSQELAEKLAAQPEIDFIAQEFIESDGDYRVLVMDNQIAVIIKRMVTARNRLIDVPLSKKVRLMPVNSLSPQVCSNVLRAVQAETLAVAGVDIIFRENSEQYYFLEVNRAPEIDTGAFTSEKIKAYALMITNKLHQEDKTVN